MDESRLVRELTEKLETLQHEKQRLERAIEGQADSIALKLRLALLAAGGDYHQPSSRNPSSSHRHSSHHHHQRRGRTISSTSPSSSLSTSSTTSASSSTSFHSSPSPLLSPSLPSTHLNPPADVLIALRENSELRTRLANSERVNQYYQREIADLRRRCGISIDELEELGPTTTNSFTIEPPSTSTSTSRRRSISIRTNSLGGQTGGGGGGVTGSIRIPGATSVSPPSVRPSTTTNPTTTNSSSYSQLSNGNNGGGASSSLYSPSYSYSQSSSNGLYNFNHSYGNGGPPSRFVSNHLHNNNSVQPYSYTSSINTMLTTPSSSFPIAVPPLPTPASSFNSTILINDTTMLGSPRSEISTISSPLSEDAGGGGEEGEDLPFSPLSASSSSNPLHPAPSSSISPQSYLPATSTNGLVASSSKVRQQGKEKKKSRRRRKGLFVENDDDEQEDKVDEVTICRRSSSSGSDEEGAFERQGSSTQAVGGRDNVRTPTKTSSSNDTRKMGTNGDSKKGKGKERQVVNEEEENDEGDGSIRDEGTVDEDPFVEAVAKSLQRLIALEGSGNRRRTGESTITSEEAENDDDGSEWSSEEDGDSDGDSSTTSREEQYDIIRAEFERLSRRNEEVNQRIDRNRRKAQGEAEDSEDDDVDEDGTPLSISPGSRQRSRRESSAYFEGNSRK